MNNAEKFQETFGIYATEMWAMPESDFLNWLNSLHDAKASNTTDLISRQDAIKALQNMPTAEALKAISEMPSADASLMQDRCKIDASSDLISRQDAIDTLAEMYCKSDEDGYVWIIRSDAWARIDALPSAEPEVKPISYTDCANAMLMMWMDEVLTDGEYNRIMDKLNAYEMKKREENG